MSGDDDSRWHLDKRVPLALILTLLIQTAGALWWAANINARVIQLEIQASASAPQIERIVRLETKMDAISSGLADIKQLLQRPLGGR